MPRCRIANRSADSVRRGFTLIELLVVIGVIALLIGILLPVVGRARTQARRTVCAANVRSIAQTCSNYAVQNGGQFPSLDLYPQSSGGNLWDVAPTFYKALVKEGVKHESFFCPATDTPSPWLAGYPPASHFYIIGYSVWIPRVNSPAVAANVRPRIIPPPLDNTHASLRFPSPKPTRPVAGPANLGDKLAADNPIVTDLVGSKGSPTPTSDIGVAGNGFSLNGDSNHREGDRIIQINAGFADGHVEVISGRDIRPRFAGNWWNWR